MQVYKSDFTGKIFLEKPLDKCYYIGEGLPVPQGGNYMKRLKDLKKGEYFTLKPITNPSEYQVCIKGDYDRSVKKYDCGCFHDISLNRYIDGNRIVYTDFTF